MSIYTHSIILSKTINKIMINFKIQNIQTPVKLKYSYTFHKQDMFNKATIKKKYNRIYIM